VKLTYGILNIGEPMAVPVIKAVKETIRCDEINILDAPPGTSCTLIETVQESDFVILVTEPTPFGLHDMIMTIDVVDKLGVPFGVIINRADIGSNDTVDYLKEKKFPILMEIPFDKHIAELYSQGIPFVTKLPEYRAQFQAVVKYIEEAVNGGK
jgi:MinD superfamily P-loop ATPase